MMSNPVGVFRSLPTLILFVAVLAWVIGGREFVDQLRVWNYEPSPRVLELVTQTAMTDRGRRLFYVADPSIEPRDRMELSCPQLESKSILGCYQSRNSQEKIIIQDVVDQRLEGVMEVTAAHEMLHAAYQRLSRQDRAEVDEHLQRVFETTDNVAIKKLLKQYPSSAIKTELHSILGTELRELDPFLEDYYSRYFINRLTVVALAEQYQSTFADIEQRELDIDRQLQDLKAKIAAAEITLKDADAQLKANQQSLEVLSNTDVASYNEQVPVFNADVNGYNSQVADLRALVDRHNRLVADYNKTAQEGRSLVEAITTDRTVAPIGQPASGTELSPNSPGDSPGLEP
jgi:hypothetical protein